jgi:hypothetical protein
MRSGRSSRPGGARAQRPLRASRLQARIALTPDHRASSYAHELGSQERKLGRIERVPDVRGWGAGLAGLGPRRAGGSTSTRATSGPGAGPGRVTGHGAARLSPSPGLAAGQATQVVSHGRHHHNRFSVASEPWFSGLNARAGSPQNRHSGPPSTRAWIHPVVLAVAAGIPSNLGVRFTLVLHDRSAPQQALEPMLDSIERMFDQVDLGSMATPEPVAVRQKETPTPDHARVVVSSGDDVDPPRHVASTWKRPTPGCAPHDTGPSRCPSTPTSSSTATASCWSTPARTGRRSPTRATSPAAPPGIPPRPPCALRHRPRRYVHRPAGGHRLRPRRCANCGAVPSPPGPHRRAAGARTPPGGTDLALGASATPPRRGFRSPGEQPAPPRASGRLPRGRVWLVPAVRVRRRPIGLVRATDHGRGGRDGRALGRRRRAFAGAPHGCASPGRCPF